VSTLSIIKAAVFDGASSGLTDGPVHVVDGRIAAVGGSTQPADRVFDAHGGTVLPGLIDAHCHAYGIDLDMLAIQAPARQCRAGRGPAHLVRRGHEAGPAWSGTGSIESISASMLSENRRVRRASSARSRSLQPASASSRSRRRPWSIASTTR
jgi:predicted amidohydrolase YtcJ